MATTASEYRKSRQPRPVEIEPGITFLVRRPDVRLLVYEGTLPTPLLAGVAELIGKWMGQDLSQLAEDAQKADGQDAKRLLDIMVCASVVDPRVVATAAEAVLDPDALCVSEIEMDAKEKIMISAFEPMPSREAEREAASRFPENGSSDGTPPDVPDVRPAAESSLTH